MSVKSGKDQSVSVKVDLPNIKDFLESCYQKYSSDDYKKDFGWIDQIAEVKDPNLIEELNGKLIENIKNNQIEKTWMAVPELVDWADVSGFSYINSTRDTTLQDDIYLPNFLDSLSEDDRNNLSVEILKRKKVFSSAHRTTRLNTNGLLIIAYTAKCTSFFSSNQIV